MQTACSKPRGPPLSSWRRPRWRREARTPAPPPPRRPAAAAGGHRPPAPAGLRPCTAWVRYNSALCLACEQQQLLLQHSSSATALLPRLACRPGAPSAAAPLPSVSGAAAAAAPVGLPATPAVPIPPLVTPIVTPVWPLIPAPVVRVWALAPPVVPPAAQRGSACGWLVAGDGQHVANSEQHGTNVMNLLTGQRQQESTRRGRRQAAAAAVMAPPPLAGATARPAAACGLTCRDRSALRDSPWALCRPAPCDCARETWSGSWTASACPCRDCGSCCAPCCSPCVRRGALRRVALLGGAWLGSAQRRLVPQAITN